MPIIDDDIRSARKNANMPLNACLNACQSWPRARLYTPNSKNSNDQFFVGNLGHVKLNVIIIGKLATINIDNVEFFGWSPVL